MMPLEKEVSLTVCETFTRAMSESGLVEDSTMAAGLEGGFVWIRLKDGRSVRVTFQVKVEQPDTLKNFQDAPTLMDPGQR